MRIATWMSAVLLSVVSSIAIAASRPVPETKVVVAASCSESMTGVFGPVKDQVKKAVEALSPKSKFDVMLFADGEPKLATDGLVSADPAGKKAATTFVDAATTAGKSDPVPAFKAGLALKPDIMIVLMDQVPDGDALLKTVKEADADGKIKITIIYLSGDDAAADKAATTALKAVIKVAHGQMKTIKKSDMK